MKSVYAISRITVSGIWFYHGLVPKLLVKHPDEFAPLLDSGFTSDQAATLVRVAGVGEILMAFVFLAFWKARWPLWMTIAMMAAALVSVGCITPRLLTAAFNPLSLNLAMISLCSIGLLTSHDTDSPRP